MYAMNSTSNIYHLLTSSQELTRCGLRVSEAEIDFKQVRWFPLHRVSEKPSERTLCRHCAKSNSEESAAILI